VRASYGKPPIETKSAAISATKMESFSEVERFKHIFDFSKA
jgi:hypothetical protein